MRSNPEFVPVTHMTETGRLGGAFGNYSNSSYQSYGAGDWGIVPYHRTYQGTQTPSYKQRKAARDLPYNGYTVRFNWVKDSPFASYRPDNDGWTYFSRCSSSAAQYSFTPSQLGLDNELTDLANRAMLGLGKQASQVRFNAAQFFGERKQTAELLASTANRVLNAAKALKRADLRAFTRALSLPGTETRSSKAAWRRVEQTPPDKRISGHWLEYVYGWRPLLQDIHDAAELIADKVNRSREPEGVLRASVNKSGSCVPALLGYPYHIKHFEFKTKVSLRCHYRLNSEARSVLSQTGLTNPALLAWELFPYSSVIDWLVPVGTYLESLTAFDGFSLIPQRSGRIVHENWATLHSFAQPSTRTTGDCSKREFRYTRENLSDWPSYVLEVRNPIGGNPLERFLTSVSLLRVLFK